MAVADKPLKERLGIERSLAQIKSRLSEEAYSGHELLKSTGVVLPERPVLAELAVRTAELGSPDQAALQKAALSLELMQLAVDLHYAVAEGDSRLRLIAADYYYARSISIASAIPSVRAVAVLSRAIAEIASAEASIAERRVSSDRDVTRKRAALFAASGEIGADLAGLDDESIDILSLFGRRTGIVYLLTRESVPGELGKGLPSVPDVIAKAVSGLDAVGKPDVKRGLAQFMRELAEEE